MGLPGEIERHRETENKTDRQREPETEQQREGKRPRGEEVRGQGRREGRERTAPGLGVALDGWDVGGGAGCLCGSQALRGENQHPPRRFALCCDAWAMPTCI